MCCKIRRNGHVGKIQRIKKVVERERVRKKKRDYSPKASERLEEFRETGTEKKQRIRNQKEREKRKITEIDREGKSERK